MKTIVTTGTVLARTNYQEADRIVTLLTPVGKIRVIAKGVRRAKSKLAGGIELFSIGEVTYLPGKRELGTLISARLKTHYGNITKDINRTMYGYEMLKRVDKNTEDGVEDEHFDLLQAALLGLDDLSLDMAIVEDWFTMQMLNLHGSTPNLSTDNAGKTLEEDSKYVFSFDDVAFAPSEASSTDANTIKFMRLLLTASTPRLLGRVQGASEQAKNVQKLIQTLGQTYLS